jgi:hypothetical protein
MFVYYRNYPALLEQQVRETFPQRVSRLRRQGLLQTNVSCINKHHFTALKTPQTESSTDPDWYTRCSDLRCPKQHHGPTLHFKQNSIFKSFPMVPLHILERVIWCFSETHPPKEALRLIVGDRITDRVTVRQIRSMYAHLRRCMSAYHRRAISEQPLGGVRTPGSADRMKCVRHVIPRFNVQLHRLLMPLTPPVPPTVVWSVPVEVDECRLGGVGGGEGEC